MSELLDFIFSTEGKDMYADGRTVASAPREGEWFAVNPKAINRQLFTERRSNPREECTRQLILEALAVADDNPKYQRCFGTLVPKRTWTGGKKVKEYKAIASELGDGMANWIEEGLEEAQRLTNGESWYHICNGPDANNCHRMISWKNGFARVVGAAQMCGIGFGSVTVREEDFDDERTVGATVPKVVRYKI